MVLKLDLLSGALWARCIGHNTHWCFFLQLDAKPYNVTVISVLWGEIPLTSPGGLLSLHLLGRLGCFHSYKLVYWNCPFFPETIGLNYTVFVKKTMVWTNNFLFPLWKNPVCFCSFVRWGAAAFSTWKLLDPQFKLKGFQGGDKKSKKIWTNADVAWHSGNQRVVSMNTVYKYENCVYTHTCFNIIMFFSYNKCNNILYNISRLHFCISSLHHVSAWNPQNPCYV